MASNAGDGAQPVDRAGGLYLLFERERRPGTADVVAALEASYRGFVSHLPQATGNGESGWAELLYDGLTFDFLGLEPGPALAFPAIRHFAPGSERHPLDDTLASGLFAGPHVAAASHSLPVVRAQLALASELLAALPGAGAVVWSPAGLLMPKDPFLRSVRNWIEGGAFPALSLVAYRQADDGSLESEGLAFFTGQEIRLAGDLGCDRLEAIRLAARLVHELVGAEPVTEGQSFTAPDGRTMDLQPTDGGTVLRISAG